MSPTDDIGKQDIAVGDGAADDVADEGDEEEDAGGPYVDLKLTHDIDVLPQKCPLLPWIWMMKAT